MGFFDFIFGSEPEQTFNPQNPLRPPGYDWADAFFNQYAPNLVGQSLPSYPGQLDPGLSPSLQHQIQAAQRYSASGFPDIMGASSAALGQYLNQPYSPYQYQEGPGANVMDRYLNPQMASPQALMGGGGDTSFGFGQGIDVTQGQGLNRLSPRSYGAPGGLRSMSAQFSNNFQQTPPIGTDFDPGFGGPGPTPRARPEDGGGGPGAVPRNPDGTPSFVPPPDETQRDFAGLGFDFRDLGPPQYSPIPVNPSFVPWTAGGAGVTAPGTGGGLTPRGPQAGSGGGGDPNAVVPQGQLEWFGNWRGPNKGQGRDYAVADMWRRGWDMGPDYQPPPEILQQWTQAGEPTGFGSKPTYQREIDQRMGNQPGGGGGGLRAGGAPSTFTPPEPWEHRILSTPGPSGGGSLPGGDGLRAGGAGVTHTPQQGGSFNPFDPNTIEMVRKAQAGAGGNPSFAPRRLPGGGAPPMAPRSPGAPGGAPPGMPQPPQPQGQPQGGTSYLDTVRGAMPIIQDQLQTDIENAMATAGFSGNRFSSSSQSRAAEAGARAGERLGSTLINSMYQDTQNNLNRGLQAMGMSLQDSQFQNQLGFQGRENFFDRQLRGAGLGGQLGVMQDNMARNRLSAPMDIFRYEQDRQDRYPLISHQDFNQGRMGYLPILAQLAQSRGAGQYVPPITTTQGGSPGLIDLAGAVPPEVWLAALSDSRLKRDIEPIETEEARRAVLGTPGRKWRWKDSGMIDAGVVAQELEEVAPQIVSKDPDTDYLRVSIPGLVGHMLTVIQDQERRLAALEQLEENDNV